MTRRYKVLSLLLATVGAIAIVEYIFLAQEHAADAAKNRPVVSAEFLQQWANIRAADKIDDPAKRCLAYPNPPWLQWNAEQVAAFCGPLAFHFISMTEMQTALGQGHPEILEQAFQKYMDENFSLREKHGILSRAFRAEFDHASPDVEHLVDQWTMLAPRSAFALTARGAYLLARAHESRGSAYMQDSSRAGLEGMEHFAAQAQSDFEAAVKINPRIVIAYCELIRIAQLSGDSALLERSVKAALAVDPADDRVYIDWMQASEPRWGGSIEDMQEIAHIAEQHVGENPLLALALEKPASYPAVERQTQGENAEAVEGLDKALLIAPSPFDLKVAGYAAMATKQAEKAIWYFSESFRFGNDVESISERASELVMIGKPEWAKESLPESIIGRARDPQELLSLANALWRLNMLPETEQVFKRILDRNPLDQNALVQLSTFYVDNPANRDEAQPLIARLIENYPQNARAWYLKSVGKSDAECHEALRKYLELADPDSLYEKDYISAAKKRLGQLDHAPN
jgi:tetratricopeptide (TPR) repeat protein